MSAARHEKAGAAGLAFDDLDDMLLDARRRTQEQRCPCGCDEG